jgi:DNA repair exonuclease SbcCD ATPase subunit
MADVTTPGGVRAEGGIVAKTEERELRDLLEKTQAKVRRLEAELAAREKSEPVAPPRPRDEEKEQAEVQALRGRVAALEAENASLRSARTEAVEQRALLETEVSQARREAARTRDEVNQLRKQLESTTQALAKSKAKVQKLSTQPGRGGASSLLGWMRGLLGGGSKDQELEAAHKEIARLNQQLSLSQFRRRGR